MIKDEEERRNFNAKKVEKTRLKNLKRNLKKKSVSPKLKSFLRQLPEKVKKIVGEGHFPYLIQGDGACGTRCFGAWGFQDQTLGPYLASDIMLIL